MKVRAIHRPRLASLLAAVLLALSVTAVSSSPASANTSRANTDYASWSRTYAMPNLSVCIKYTWTARITYNAKRYGPTSAGYTDYWVENVYVRDHKLVSSLVRYDSVSHACTSTGVKWKKLSVAASWSGYSCSFNPSLSVGYPWGVSVAGWPSCGDRRQARYSSGYDSANGIAGPSQTQQTSGTVHYANRHLVYQPSYLKAPTKGPCYGGWVYQHVFVGNHDQSVSHPARQICLTPVW